MSAVVRFAVLLAAVVGPLSAAESIPPIPRVLPPVGLEIPADVRTRLETRLAETKLRLEAAAAKASEAGPRTVEGRTDIEVFLKAVELALLHREFYSEKDFAKADWALEQANQRLDNWIQERQGGRGAPAVAPVPWEWSRMTGTVVRGYRSSIDGSVQPYGLVIPENHNFEKPCPLYVWLHGRGDKNTDLHFLYERATRAGQITPPGAIVLHPFGRHCVGWKHAGEFDVLEAIGDVQTNYNIDPNRIVLIGFSMGGAGAWHIGAHYSSIWIAVAPGAGFAETARYQRLTPDRYPPWYEQKLWGLYDVPGYVRNLFNTEVIAYSGELDKQIQAARVMEEAFQSEGRKLTHLIGPGVEHKYEPETLKELLRRLDVIVTTGRELFPQEAHLQTRTLRYGHQSWIVAEQLEEHWTESRIDAVRTPDRYSVNTKNVVRFKLVLPAEFQAKTEFIIDGEVMPAAAPGQGLRLPDKVGGFKIKNRGVETRQPQFVSGQAAFIRRNGKWHWLTPDAEEIEARHLLKRPQLQGPIDDIYMREFLVITPTGKSKNSRFQAWVDFEIAHFRDRWRALMRGEPPMKTDAEFTDADALRPLVLWGDPDSNSVMRRMLDKTWIDFQDGQWTFGGQTFDGDRYVPALIYPRRVTRTTPAFGNRLARQSLSYAYTVLNSGLTFREGHDRTNSLQNPKLPDWAVIDLTQPPDAFSPGRIHDAGFFDEAWQFKNHPAK